MSRILLVPDPAFERWPSMDRYAAALAQRLPVDLPSEARTLSGSRYLMRYVTYPRVLARYRPQLVHIADHSYAHCLAAFPGVPSVVTVHDLHPLHIMRLARLSPRALFRDAMLRRTMAWAARADRIVTVSAFVAEEVRRLMGVPADRTRVVPNGVDDAFFRAPAAADVASRRRVWLAHARAREDATILLHVGSCVPRKRVELAIAAAGALRRRGGDVVLVQTGGAFSPAQQAAIRAAGMADRTLQETWVSEEALVAGYHAANVLLMPSDYEGFGLPVLEALAAGLPVVSSGAGGLGEAGGEAAVTLTSPSPDAWADAVAQLLSDETDRLRRRALGITYAHRHSWDAAAQGIRKVYDELLP